MLPTAKSFGFVIVERNECFQRPNASRTGNGMHAAVIFRLTILCVPTFRVTILRRNSVDLFTTYALCMGALKTLHAASLAVICSVSAVAVFVFRIAFRFAFDTLPHSTSTVLVLSQLRQYGGPSTHGSHASSSGSYTRL